MESSSDLPSVSTGLRSLLPRRRASRLLFALAVLFLASAAFHTFVLAADGWQWSGSVSWRKPVLFSLSLGSLAWAMAWIIDRLPARRRLAGAIAGTYVMGAIVELFLVSLQTWRGRASHFNVAEAGDAVIFSAMGAAVGVLSLSLIGLFGWVLVQRPADRATRWASIGGLIYVTAGLGLGQWLIDLGFDFVDRVGAVPETVLYGAAGVAKFPHAVAFHGIHVFMLLTAVMAARGLEGEAARRLMALAVVSYGAVLLYASAQTLLGLAPLTVSVPLLFLGGSGAVGLTAAFAGALRRQVPAREPSPLLARS